MSKMALLGFLLLLLSSPGHPTGGKFAKYKQVEAYEIRPGILVMPSYTNDGQLCEMGLEQRQYSPELIRLDPSLTRGEIDEIFDEFVPESERGAKSDELVSVDGGGITTIETFTNVWVKIYGKDLSPADRKRHKIVERVVTATVQWKNRKCQ